MVESILNKSKIQGQQSQIVHIRNHPNINIMFYKSYHHQELNKYSAKQHKIFNCSQNIMSNKIIFNQTMHKTFNREKKIN